MRKLWGVCDSAKLDKQTAHTYGHALSGTHSSSWPRLGGGGRSHPVRSFLLVCSHVAAPAEPADLQRLRVIGVVAVDQVRLELATAVFATRGLGNLSLTHGSLQLNTSIKVIPVAFAASEYIFNSALFILALPTNNFLSFSLGVRCIVFAAHLAMATLAIALSSIGGLGLSVELPVGLETVAALAFLVGLLCQWSFNLLGRPRDVSGVVGALNAVERAA